MTITPWTIYLITLLGDVRDAAKLLTVVGAAVVALQVLYVCLCFDVAMKDVTVIEKLKEALQKPSLILRPENFCLLHKLNFCANDCSGYF